MATDRARPAQPRIHPRTDIPADMAELVAVRGSGPPLNILATLAHAPNVLKRFSQMGGSLLFRGSVPDREREIVILRVGHNCASVYEFGQHTVIGKAAGLTDSEIKALTEDVNDGSWSDRDRALIALADDLCTDDCVGDHTWAALANSWDDRQLVELIVCAGFYRMVSGFLNSGGVQLDEGVPGWPA